ncbi:MAG TPA: dienelactone hydrolase family protein [Polyangia bacterium]|nr:dienelactone hydrolase family protein [Polyangia bacterium]
MAIATETILKDGFTGYLARPDRASGPLPGLLVIQEAWGVDAHIEDVTRRLAAAGYVALAPDLYAQGGQRPEALSRERLTDLLAFASQAGASIFADAQGRAQALATRPEAERARLAESLDMLAAVGFAPTKRDDQLAVLQAAASYLRTERSETKGQKVGAIGFCMGGGLAALLACRDPRLGAAVILYGSAPPPAEIPAIGCPVLGLYGGKDPRITGQVPALVEAMTAAGKRFEHHVYPEAGHAFFNDNRPTYDPGAARDAFVRALVFLRDALPES